MEELRDSGQCLPTPALAARSFAAGATGAAARFSVAGG